LFFKPFRVVPIVVIPLGNEFAIRARYRCVPKVTEKINVLEVNVSSVLRQRPVQDVIGHDQELPIGVRLPIETGQSTFRQRRARRARDHQTGDLPGHASTIC
jgi:hypothetical protein